MGKISRMQLACMKKDYIKTYWWSINIPSRISSSWRFAWACTGSRWGSSIRAIRKWFPAAYSLATYLNRGECCLPFVSLPSTGLHPHTVGNAPISSMFKRDKNKMFRTNQIKCISTKEGTITYMPPFLVQSMNHCVDGVYPEEVGV